MVKCDESRLFTIETMIKCIESRLFTLETMVKTQWIKTFYTIDND
jgi:hypothetical protein